MPYFECGYQSLIYKYRYQQVSTYRIQYRLRTILLVLVGVSYTRTPSNYVTKRTLLPVIVTQISVLTSISIQNTISATMVQYKYYTHISGYTSNKNIIVVTCQESSASILSTYMIILVFNPIMSRMLLSVIVAQIPVLTSIVLQYQQQWYADQFG